MEKLQELKRFQAFAETFEEPSQEEIDNLVQKLKRKKDQVKYLLKTYPETRSNDLSLQLAWLHIFGKIKLPKIQQQIICKFSGALESVRRTRQKIQNDEGLYLPLDPKIREMRRRRSQAYRKAITKV